MQNIHPVDTLFKQMREIGEYPKDVVPIRQRIEGTAFFPGGYGLWGTEPGKPLPPMPIGKVMIIGHDFGTEKGYQNSLTQLGENLKEPTWRNLLGILDSVPLTYSDCFFTNAYMGLRSGVRVMGRFPGARSRSFVEQCQKFLAYQITAQRPRLIITLGRYVPSFIAPLSADLEGWKRCESFRMLDTQGPPVLANVKFDGNISVKATVVALTHPSLWHRCVLGRRYGFLSGKVAELQMLKEAVELSGILNWEG